MTPDKRKALREAAEKATPGPWVVYPETDGREIYAVDFVPRLPIRGSIVPRGKNWIADNSFIALANPATILSLLDALAASEEKLEKARDDALEEAAQWHENQTRFPLSVYETAAEQLRARKRVENSRNHPDAFDLSSATGIRSLKEITEP